VKAEGGLACVKVYADNWQVSLILPS
jgi:hypothetical protein